MSNGPIIPARAAAAARAPINPSPFASSVASKGRVGANRWLLARRLVQIGILALFMAGPLAGVWIVKGNLASSLTLDVLPLTDPYTLLQGFAAGELMTATAVAGAAIVAIFYALVGGRVYCSWVCPVNMVTDAAAWLRTRLGLSSGRPPPRMLRYWLLGVTFIVAFLTGTIAWELVNPVSMLHRGLIFGVGFAWTVVVAVFLFDLFVSPRGWCGHVCPVGAFYSLLGTKSLLRVSAARSSQCNDCTDCYRVCPEPQVIPPALKGTGSPIIASSACTNCARCIDVCSLDVFRFALRFDQRRE
ncbi:MAG: quinol dehydrogenase ferredoxin subunit NapH [Burkholderiales bacterium]|nr:quinol dehydrogenase ferredoxin subunit NapH [Burkholderiales bacterium]